MHVAVFVPLSQSIVTSQVWQLNASSSESWSGHPPAQTPRRNVIKQFEPKSGIAPFPERGRPKYTSLSGSMHSQLPVLRISSTPPRLCLGPQIVESPYATLAPQFDAMFVNLEQTIGCWSSSAQPQLVDLTSMAGNHLLPCSQKYRVHPRVIVGRHFGVPPPPSAADAAPDKTIGAVQTIAPATAPFLRRSRRPTAAGPASSGEFLKSFTARLLRLVRSTTRHGASREEVTPKSQGKPVQSYGSVDMGDPGSLRMVSSTWAPAPNVEVAWVELDGEVVVFHAGEHRAHLLNATGSLLWQLLDGTVTIGELATDVAAVFDLSREEAADQVRRFAEEMEALRLLAPRESGKPA